jgi:hypothetical protein
MNRSLRDSAKLALEDARLEPKWKIAMYSGLAGAWLALVYQSVPWIAHQI